jgi:L-aminopeptidase/D-esterase-like protein
VESVDEAILNALFTGGDMTGRDGNVRDGLPVDKVIGYLKHHNMWVDPEA